ncbi:AraC-type DNA-binding protein [Alteromonadaceae bacterium Bs31]|nr:AraC-type DNA-binding protein [Alteromonadaceae bacterium Bs31]
MARFPIQGVILILLTITALTVFALFQLSGEAMAFFPAEQSPYKWRATAGIDESFGGASSLQILDDSYGLDYEFELSEAIEFPYAAVLLEFFDGERHVLVDWSRYSALTFRVKCRPHNVLTVSVIAFDERVTKLDNFASFRQLQSFVSCSNEWQDVKVDLRKLDTPDWWLVGNELEVSDTDYSLEKVKAVAFINSRQSPLSTPSGVKLVDLQLTGRSPKVLFVGFALIILVWLSLAVWYLISNRSLTKTTGEHEQNEPKETLKVIPYKTLEIAEKNEKEQATVMAYMAKEYSNPSLNLEHAVAALGINRTKFNQILKESTGLTFVAYLNKLRLSEAARLLSEKDTNISEIAYAVGYNSVPYFNRLFKQEFGDSPTSFKQKSGQTNSDDSV